MLMPPIWASIALLEKCCILILVLMLTAVISHCVAIHLLNELQVQGHLAKMQVSIKRELIHCLTVLTYTNPLKTQTNRKNVPSVVLNIFTLISTTANPGVFDLINKNILRL